ncbi:peptidylprolyl isomerase [Phyllobacterium leguminum]|uniref:Parvulin-like PPIase n=1 Tax=Phyllobacterium leguminum TaxID=314237 RepID=A0A318T2P4_9HYPH|nr:peptidylprolyl isomerase [Phyllobacterium leguminum]PYE88977.1 peptidyl-prolyl cis-trans isomerase C [Phyllobacterium leguminum]
MTYYRKALSALAATALIAIAAHGAYAQDKAPVADPAKVLATVNGQPITQAEVDQASSDLDPQFSRLPAEQRRLAALAALIDIKALATKGKTEKLDQTPEFKQRMDFLQDRALHNAYFEKEIVGKISDADVRARYDKEMAATPPQNEVRARHILVKTKEEADAIIKKLDGGAKFEDLAKENSTDGSAANGGDLGYFSQGQMVPEFEKAALALEPGKYTKEPVQTQFGYHVIKLEDKRAQQPPAYDQVKEQVRSIIMRERYVDLMKKLRGDLKVSYTDPEIEKAMKQASGEAAPAEAAPAKETPKP